MCSMRTPLFLEIVKEWQPYISIICFDPLRTQPQLDAIDQYINSFLSATLISVGGQRGTLQLQSDVV